MLAHVDKLLRVSVWKHRKPEVRQGMASVGPSPPAGRSRELTRGAGVSHGTAPSCSQALETRDSPGSVVSGEHSASRTGSLWRVAFENILMMSVFSAKEPGRESIPCKSVTPPPSVIDIKMGPSLSVWLSFLLM